jgi:aryl-alcohol dehydrogenase
VPIGGHFFGQSSFASHSLVDEQNVVVVPSETALEVVAPLGCGVQTGAGAVLYALRPLAGSRIAVFGAGLIGLSAVMAAAVVGCTTIIAIDPDPRRLELAVGAGATATVDPTQDDAVDRILAMSGDGVDFSVETSGKAEVLRAAVDGTAPFGTCAVIGPAPVGTEAVLDVNMLLFGRSVRGVIGGHVAPGVCIPTLIGLHRQGRFPFDRLLRHYAFDDINEAINDMLSGEILKPVIRMAE